MTEDDARYGTSQYAMHRSLTNFRRHSTSRTTACPSPACAPPTSPPHKVRGSVDHVQLITAPARGEPITLPSKSFMRLPIHVEDIAEVFVRVLLADAPRYAIYNSGGTPISLGELADLVREFLPKAQITFAKEGGRDESGTYLVDNSRLCQEFEIEYPPFRTRVLEIINDVRRQEGLPLVEAR